MKTRVIEYIPRIKDAGAETLVKDYALLLNKDEFEVIVLCENIDVKSANYNILKENNIQIVTTYGKLDYFYRVVYRIFGSWFSSKLLRKKLILLKPDTIHIHLQQLEDIKRNVDILKNVKLIYTCHNIPEKMLGNERPKEYEACKFLLENNQLQIIALHDEMAKQINSMFNINNTAVIKNGIDFNRFLKCTKNKNEKRIEIGIPKDSYVIGHIGRFHEQKNHTFIIDVFYNVLKKKENSHLLLVGDGALKEEIEKKANDLGIYDSITFLSNREDIPELLKTMDLFLFPSKWEGLGIVLIEAQVLGIPCVVSDKVPSEAFQSNKITQLKLNDNICKWVDSCIKPVPNITKFGDINNYDINKEIKKLEKLYKNDAY